MTLQEVYKQSKDQHREAVRTALKKGATIADLDCENITELYIFHDYAGEIPDLAMFPKLVMFSSSVALPAGYLDHQDLSAITSLRLTFNNGSGTIRIVAPSLTDLDIHIRNNDEDQLSLFVNNANAIDISQAPKLRKLKLSHTTGYDILTGGKMNSVECVVVIDMRACDFRFINNFPSVRRLTIGSSGCEDISFVRELRSLEHTDFSYNQIEDISCLRKLPKLKSVNIYRNNVQDISCLDIARDSVVWTEEDHSFLSFKQSVDIDIVMGYSYVQHCRKPNPRRGKFWDEVYSKKSDEDLFLNYFRAKVKEEIDNYTVDAKKHYHTPVPLERLSAYIKMEFPFVNYVYSGR